MRDFFVVVEHREGGIRDVSFEMLGKATELSKQIESSVSAILLGHNVDALADEVSYRGADQVLVIDDERLEQYSAEGHRKILSSLIREKRPLLTMIGHTSYGMDFAPALAVDLDLPLATDCTDIRFEDGGVMINRQMYGARVNASVRLSGADQYLLTVRPTVFRLATEDRSRKAQIIHIPSTLFDQDLRSRFIALHRPPVEDVDITKADVVVAVGRGIGKQENMPLVNELASVLNGVVACSRPVIDMGWLPKGRQVGSSGKTVKPKLYIALGISGAINHVMGMKGSKLVVAINKDPGAPIFDVADYGVVCDLLDIVPLLTERLKQK